jgi:hypothetical protein
MDVNLDGFFELENIISAIFNGAPLAPDLEGNRTLPPTRTAQGSHVPPSATPTLTSTSTSSSTSTSTSTSTDSLGMIVRSESSPSSLSTQSGDDAHKQVRSREMAPPLKSGKPPAVYTDSSGQLHLALGKLHLVL